MNSRGETIMKPFSILLFVLLLSGPTFGQVVDLERPLANADVITLLEAGISEQVIIARIKVSPSKFDTSAEGLKTLKLAGAGDALLMTILELRHPAARPKSEPALSPAPTPVATPVAAVPQDPAVQAVPAAVAVPAPAAPVVSATPAPAPEPSSLPPEPPPYQPPARSEKRWYAPRAEGFSGFSYRRSEGGVNAYGWNSAVNGNFNPWLGIVGDVSGTYNSQSILGERVYSASIYSFLFGPQLTARHGRISFFSRGLVGGTRIIQETIWDDKWGLWLLSYGWGGGVDIGITPGFAIRVGQADAIINRNAGETSTDMRLSFGIVWR
jgi:hypothetical protein